MSQGEEKEPFKVEDLSGQRPKKRRILLMRNLSAVQH